MLGSTELFGVWHTIGVSHPRSGRRFLFLVFHQAKSFIRSRRWWSTWANWQVSKPPRSYHFPRGGKQPCRLHSLVESLHRPGQHHNANNPKPFPARRLRLPLWSQTPQMPENCRVALVETPPRLRGRQTNATFDASSFNEFIIVIEFIVIEFLTEQASRSLGGSEPAGDYHLERI